MRTQTYFHLNLILLLILFSFLNCKNRAGHSGMLEVSGMIEAIDTEIRSQVQGEVKEIFVKEGQQIKKGELLCLIDDEKLKIQLNQVQAGLEKAQFKLKLFKKGTKKELIAIAKNRLGTAKRELELAQKNQERISRLFKEGAVSEAQNDEAGLKLKTALEQYQSAKENYGLAFRGREKEEIEMAEAEIKNFQAQEQFLLRQIQDTKVKAPSNCFLEVRQIEVGELAFPGTLLFTMIDLERTYVKAYLPERYVGRIKIGNSVKVICDSYPERIFPGKVDYVSDQAEFAPKNIQTKEERLKLVFMIKSYIENKERLLKPGMPVDVKIKLENK